MPKNSQDATFQEWEEILIQLAEAETGLAGAASFREALREANARAVGHECLRDVLYATAQIETQRLQEALAEGRDAASRLRNFLRGVLGPRNEELLRYGIKPLRKRGRTARTTGCALN